MASSAVFGMRVCESQSAGENRGLASGRVRPRFRFARPEAWPIAPPPHPRRQRHFGLRPQAPTSWRVDGEIRAPVGARDQAVDLELSPSRSANQKSPMCRPSNAWQMRPCTRRLFMLPSRLRGAEGRIEAPLPSICHVPSCVHQCTIRSAYSMVNRFVTPYVMPRCRPTVSPHGVTPCVTPGWARLWALSPSRCCAPGRDRLRLARTVGARRKQHDTNGYFGN